MPCSCLYKAIGAPPLEPAGRDSTIAQSSRKPENMLQNLFLNLPPRLYLNLIKLESPPIESNFLSIYLPRALGTSADEGEGSLSPPPMPPPPPPPSPRGGPPPLFMAATNGSQAGARVRFPPVAAAAAYRLARLELASRRSDTGGPLGIIQGSPIARKG